MFSALFQGISKVFSWPTILFLLAGSALGQIFGILPGLTGSVAEDAYRDKVLRTFFKHGRLTQIPAQQKKRLVVLEHLLQEFEPGRPYPEREVNHILLEFNEDVATLRREMIDHKMMTREKGIYQRVVE